MQTILMTFVESNMMNLPYNVTINNQWQALCEKENVTSIC